MGRSAQRLAEVKALVRIVVENNVQTGTLVPRGACQAVREVRTVTQAFNL